MTKDQLVIRLSEIRQRLQGQVYAQSTELTVRGGWPNEKVVAQVMPLQTLVDDLAALLKDINAG